MKDRPHTNNAPGGITRRDFLKTTAAAGAGFALAPSVLRGAGGGDADAINVALIGAGTQGQVLMMNCLKIAQPKLRFKAVCDIWEYSQRRAAGRLRAFGHPVNVYEDYREMLEKEKDLDAAIVATPDWVHAEHAIACMEAGLDVYCEKEMSNDLTKARKMVEVSRTTGKLLQIGHQRRSNPRYLHTYHKLLGEAKLPGRITQAYGQWNRSVAASGPRGYPEAYAIPPEKLKKYGYENMTQFRDWRWYRKFGGGPIADLGSHQIDIFGWFLGTTPKTVMASGGRDYWTDYEWYDHVYAVYEFETEAGTVRAMYQTLATTSARGYYEAFMGIDGTVAISENPGQCRVYAEGHIVAEADGKPWQKWLEKGYIVEAPGRTDEPQTASDAIISVYKSEPPMAFMMNVKLEDTAHRPHLRNFFNAVVGKEKLNCPAEVAYETAVQVLRVNEAVASGKTLTFKDGDFKA